MANDPDLPALLTSLSEVQRERLQPSEGLHAELNRIADRLCTVIGGDYELRVRAELDDAILQKLCVAINFLLDTVRRNVEAAEAKNRELQHNLETIAAQQGLITSLSTPLLRVRRDVLVLPLIGVLDERRCEQLGEALLAEVAARKARWALIDVTGVALVDARSAANLARVAGAVGLLGARCILTGVRPDLAQTLIGIGADLSRFEVARDLEQGLAACM